MGSLKYRFQFPVFKSITSNAKCVNTGGSRERNLQLLLSVSMPYLSEICLAKRTSFPKPLPSTLRIKHNNAALAFKGWI